MYGAQEPPPEAYEPGGSRPTAARQSGLRVPPHNREAEESVLGAILLSAEAVNLVMDRLAADDFYVPAHAAIYEAIGALYGQNQPIDAITIADHLRNHGELDRVGGIPFLTDLTEAVPTAANVEYYASIVSEQSVRRRLLSAGATIGQLATTTDQDIDWVIDEAEQAVFAVAERKVGDGLSAIGSHMDATIARIEELESTAGHVTGLPTGFRDLDEKLSGLQKANLVVVAARPGMGKSVLSLNVARNVALKGSTVAVFSLEMSKDEIIQRLICSTGRIDNTRLRAGNLGADMWPRVLDAADKLFKAPIFVDESSYLTVTDVRAKCRRLQRKHGLDLVIIDYLQLMQGRSRENRQQEIAEISRGLKNLARELDVPIIAVSQLNRSLEARNDKRPQLGDLRECLTFDTPVLRADTGAVVPIGELARSGARDVPVWSLDDDFKLVPAVMSEAWSTGVKQVFAITTKSGRALRATANHPLRTLDGWTPVGDLGPGSRIAVPRLSHTPIGAPTRWPDERVVLLAHLVGDGSYVRRQPIRYTSADPECLDVVGAAAKAEFGIEAVADEVRGAVSLRLPAPFRLARGRRNPIAAWLDELGIFGQRSHEKRLPDAVFGLPSRQIRLFLRHLWATDGSVTTRKEGRRSRIYYASNSRRLAEDVMRLLLRVGVVARLKKVPQGEHRPMWTVDVSGVEEQRTFLRSVGVHGSRSRQVDLALLALDGVEANTNVDTVPREVWEHVKSAMTEAGVTHRRLASELEMAYSGLSMFRFSPSRSRLGRVAGIVDSPSLATLAGSDVFWDEVVAIRPDGEEETFDARVPGTHCFVAGDVVVHNSGAIEQDSDIVMFIYRDEYYNPESDDRGIAEVAIAKHRAGATGRVFMSFAPAFTSFGDLARDPGV